MARNTSSNNLPAMPPNPAEQLIGAISHAIHEWKQENPPEKMKADVIKGLDQAKKQIVMKLLGFDNDSWGGWRIDHCNGRAGESEIGDYLRKVQRKAVQEWAETVTMPTLGAKERDKLIAEANKEYMLHLSRSIRSMAQAKAQQDAQELVNAATQTSHLETVEKLKQLLQAST